MRGSSAPASNLRSPEGQSEAPAYRPVRKESRCSLEHQQPNVDTGKMSPRLPNVHANAPGPVEAREALLPFRIGTMGAVSQAPLQSSGTGKMASEGVLGHRSREVRLHQLDMARAEATSHAPQLHLGSPAYLDGTACLSRSILWPIPTLPKRPPALVPAGASWRAPGVLPGLGGCRGYLGLQGPPQSAPWCRAGCRWICRRVHCWFVRPL
jgi:hypothetical protein